MPIKHKMYLTYNGTPHHVEIDPSVDPNHASIAWDDNYKSYPAPSAAAVAASVNSYFANLNIDIKLAVKPPTDYSIVPRIGRTPFTSFWIDSIEVKNDSFGIEAIIGDTKFTIPKGHPQAVLNALFTHCTVQTIGTGDDEIEVLALRVGNVMYCIAIDVGIVYTESSGKDSSVTSIIDIATFDWADAQTMTLEFWLDDIYLITPAQGCRFPLGYESIGFRFLTSDDVDNGWRWDHVPDRNGLGKKPDEGTKNLTYVTQSFNYRWEEVKWTDPSEVEPDGTVPYYFNALSVTGGSGVLVIPRTVPVNLITPQLPIARTLSGSADTVYYINDVYPYGVSMDFEQEKLINLATSVVLN